MTEQTTRAKHKWAKVSGSRGKWAVALGWNGEMRADKVSRCSRKDLALAIARNWVADQ